MQADRPGSAPASAAAPAVRDRGAPGETSNGAADVPGSSPPPDLVMLDAMELSWAIHAKRVSCREVMEAHLGHIGRMNPAANAIVPLRPREFLLAEAQERDDYLARGEMAG